MNNGLCLYIYRREYKYQYKFTYASNQGKLNMLKLATSLLLCFNHFLWQGQKVFDQESAAESSQNAADILAEYLDTQSQSILYYQQAAELGQNCTSNVLCYAKMRM